MTTELDTIDVYEDGQLALSVSGEQTSIFPLVSPDIGDVRLPVVAVPTIFAGQEALDV